MKNLTYPEFLKKGDVIGITAPSDGNSRETDFARLDNGKKQIEERGYKVIETASVRHSENGRSTDAKTRAKEFIDLTENNEVKAIFSASGGDYLLEILPYLDFDKIKANPKWFQGYSDNTGLVHTITTICDQATIYGNNFNDFGMANWHKSVDNNLRILEGKNIVQESFETYQDGFYDYKTGLESYKLTKPVKWRNINREGEVVMTGRTLGGCLDVLISLVGTRFDKTVEFLERHKDDGIIWYLESFDLSAESLTIALWQLKEAGWFKNANGFVFGRPTFYDEEASSTYEEVVLSVLGQMDLPIILEADIGHKPPQFSMINGGLGTLYSKDGKAKLSYDLLYKSQNKLNVE